MQFGSIDLYISSKISMQAQPQRPARQPFTTIAEQRQMITPGDPDSYFDQSDQDSLSLSSDQDSNNQENTEVIVLNSQIISNQQNSTIKIEEKLQESQVSQKSQKIEKESILAQKQVKYKSYVHNIDEKFAVLMMKMIKNKFINLLDITGLKNKGNIDFYCKQSKVNFLTTDKVTADEAISKLSDFIDDLNVLKLDIRPEMASKLQKFTKIKAEFAKRKIVLFGLNNGNNNNHQRTMYIGGEMKVSELKKIQTEIKSYSILHFYMRRIRNKRSYKIILNIIFQSEFMIHQMIKFNGIYLLEVDRSNKQKNIRLLMNTKSKIDLSPSQIQQFICKNLQKYTVITYILQTQQKYFEKLSIPQHPDITFRYIKQTNQKRKNLTYLIIVCLKETFYLRKNEIQNQIEKVGDFIIGCRFFNYIYPKFQYFFFEPNVYYVKKFPIIYPYSMMVFAKTHENKKYYWRQTFNMYLSIKQVEQEKVQQEEYNQ